MKNIFNRILSFLFVIMVFNLLSYKVSAIVMEDKTLKVYDIKEKEEVILNSDKVVTFYEETHEEVNKMIEEERERILEERRINKKKELANYAKKFVGNPYVRGGNSLTNGTDCSGFVKLIYANYGVKLSRTASGQSKEGVGVRLDDIEIGDIISYGYDGRVTHSALYIGDGKIVHASTEIGGIRIDKIGIMQIITIRRVM